MDHSAFFLKKRGVPVAATGIDSSNLHQATIVNAMPLIRAVVFDLDDTLYPEREFVFSGFRAIAESFADYLGSAYEIAADMRRLFDGPFRATVFQRILADRKGTVDPSIIKRMRDVYREHQPTISLYPDADAALTRLRAHYKLGLITDGDAGMQRRKIAALMLEPRFDAIILTAELAPPANPDDRCHVQAARGHEPDGCHAQVEEKSAGRGGPWRAERGHESDGCHVQAERGHDSGGEPVTAQDNSRSISREPTTGLGKPHPRAFEMIAERLAVKPHECAYVADNVTKDFVAPNALGWRTVRILRPDGLYKDAQAAVDGEPQRIIDSLDQLDCALDN